MLGAHLVLLRVTPGADEVAERFVFPIRHPHRGEIASAEKATELECVSPVGLDPIARASRNQRRRDYSRIDPESRQLAVQRESGSTSFVRCHQVDVIATKAVDQLTYCARIVRHFVVRL